jgi:4-nitrophenyl phosphatase
MPDLQKIKGFVIDMDGVLWHGDNPLPGLSEFFSVLREKGKRFVLATNNNTRKPEGYVEKFAGYGIIIDAREILTASVATVEYIKKKYPIGSRIHILAEKPFKELVTEHGFVLADQDVCAVVVSMDRELTYEKLRIACLLIRQGAEFIGANPDVCYPTPQGMAPGSGTLIAAVAAGSGNQPLIIGKPEPWLFRAALSRMGLKPNEAASIGDRLDTDIEGALRLGMNTLLVLSGVTKKEDLSASAIKPNWVFDGIADLIKEL